MRQVPPDTEEKSFLTVPRLSNIGSQGNDTRIGILGCHVLIE